MTQFLNDPDERRELSRAGMVEKKQGGWYPDRQFPAGSWYRPKVELHGGALLWDYGGEARDPVDGMAERVPVSDFAGLCDEPDEAIRDYADRWGVLLVCEHGLHARHGPVHRPSPATGMYAACKLTRTRAGAYREPLAVWRDYSRRAQAVLRIAACLHQGKPGDHSDWHAFGYEGWSEGTPDGPFTLDDERMFIALEVSGWLEEARLQLLFGWPSGGPTISFGAGTLFAALAAQLLWTVSRTPSFAVCSACGRLYFPKRRPAKSRRSYCPDCGVRVSRRDAKRDERARKRGQG